MSHSLYISAALRKIIPKSVDDNAIPQLICQTIAAKEHEIGKLLAVFDESLNLLTHYISKIAELIAILEELGGITVQAKQLCLEGDGYKTYQKEIDTLAARFSATLTKLDDFVATPTYDTDDENTNLLVGGHLTTPFDAEGQQKLVTHGLNLTAKNLGFRTPNFTTAMQVQNSRIDVMNAMDVVMALRAVLRDDVFTITTRQEFSQFAIDLARTGQTHITTAKSVPEVTSLLAFAQKKIDGPLAEPSQTETLDYFRHKIEHKE